MTKDLEIPITFSMTKEVFEEFMKEIGDGIIRDEKGNEIARLSLKKP